MLTLRHSALASVATMAFLAALSPKAEAALLPFTFNPAYLGYAPGGTAVQGDEITLSSSSLVTQNSTGQVEHGYAQVSDIKLNGSSVGSLSDGIITYTTPPASNPLNFYGLYIVYDATTNLLNFASEGPLQTFTFSLYADQGANDTFTPANAGAGTSPSVSSLDTDPLLATGSLAPGFGSFAGFNTNGGPVFDLTTTFNLTAAGMLYFTAPVPFYSLEFTTATGSAPGNATISGKYAAISTTLDSSFQVPEPSSMLLLGSALLGFGLLFRHRNRRA